MKLSFSSLTQFCLYLTILVASLAHSRISFAQVTSDGTVNTQVNQNGNVAEITGGETRGSNLFHSFQDFSVGNGGEAFFNNAQNIDNILSRVTGGNVSNINGAIRANGSANLFLINPAGIVFGDGARLDLGGSFYGSSASSILFEDGEFNAADLDNPPLLTVNAPIGFTFRENPGEIINRSDAQNSRFSFGLAVLPGESLFLLGGNVRFDRGRIQTVAGNVELGGISEAGTISIDNDGGLEFPVGINKSNVDLVNSNVQVSRGEAGGSITINAANLNLDGAEGRSSLNAGLNNVLTPNNTQPADVEIQVDNNLLINTGNITSNVGADLIGDGGNITIDTSILELSNGGEISTTTFSDGNAGAINITANDITIDGGSTDDGITSQVATEGVGNAGEINLNTGNLTLTNGGQITGSTFGEGDAGSINITARETIRIDGEDNSNVSSITSLVEAGAQGNAGNLTIDTNNLNLTNGGQVNASTIGEGNSGLVEITATDTILVQGEDSQGIFSGVISAVGESASGDSQGISITADNLNLTNGGRVDATTLGEGNSGLVEITATDTILVQGETSQGIPSGVFSNIDPFASGNSEGITFTTDNLNLIDGGRVDASTRGEGNSGLVSVTASDSVNIIGESSQGNFSGVFSNVEQTATGSSEGISITTDNLNLTDGAIVSADTSGQGDSGLISVTASNSVTITGEDSQGFGSTVFGNVRESASGNSQGISITTENLNLTNGARVDASTSGEGNSGLVEINASDTISVQGEDSQGNSSGVFSTVEQTASGNSQGVSIATKNLNLTDGGSVEASTFGQGNSGLIDITAENAILIEGISNQGFARGILSVVGQDAAGNSGGVNVTTSLISINDGNFIEVSTFGQGNAGDLIISSSESISVSGTQETSRGGLFANAAVNNGNGGNINITANQLNVDDGGTIEASNFDSFGVFDPGTGEPGNIAIAANSINLANEARIEAATQSDSSDSANVNLQVNDDIRLSNSSFISAQALGNASGGNLNIDTNFIVAFPNGNNDIIASAAQGQGGNININAEAVFGIQERPLSNSTNDINASSDVLGLDGSINIETLDFNPLQGIIEIVTGIVEPEQTTAQACNTNREEIAKQGNGLTIKGQGGIVPAPDLPLNSQNALIDGKIDTPITSNAKSVSTGIGNIVPARGARVDRNGQVILTAHAVNNKQRGYKGSRNCSVLY